MAERPILFLGEMVRAILKVERVQEISLAGIEAEGISDDHATFNAPKQLTKFQTLWDSINAKRGYSWESNPWVWALTFKRAAVK